MDTRRWNRVEELYYAAAELPLDARACYLVRECGGDEDLRREVESLLSASEAGGDFLETSEFSLGLSLLSAHRGDEALSSGEEFGHYIILERIGEGGMGEVYLARDRNLNRKVALKLLPECLAGDTALIKRFSLEARLAAAISHQYVAHIYETGEFGGRAFIAMEYVPGETLRERLCRVGLLPIREAAEIAIQIAEAIAAAHEAGVVHRDIKPENVILRQDGRVKVLDFGLAKLSEANGMTVLETGYSESELKLTTEKGVILGTSRYMSPEQARGQETDARTDIWSWGVVFYEMLVGQPPFAGATSSDVIAEIIKSEAQLRHINLPDPVKAILHKSLSKDRNGRYAAMAELLFELRTLSRRLEEGETLLHENRSIQGVAASEEVARRELSRVGSLTDRTFQSTQPSHRIGDDAGAAVTIRSRADTKGASTLSPVLTNLTERKVARRALGSPLFIGIGVLSIVIITFVIQSLDGLLVANRKDVIISPQINHLTNDGRVLDAAISGDARLLAYVPIESGRHSLWIRDLKSGERWQILPPDPALCWGMRFTPNGQSILYITTQPGSSVSVLYRMPVRGGPSHKLVVNVDTPPAISPDGMRIAFVRRHPTERRDALIISNVDGSAEREMASRNHPDRFALSGMSWSSDGKMIALGAGRNNETESAVVGMPAQGGSLIELTPWRWSAVRGVAWRNDGQTLVFSARAMGARTLRIWRLTYPDGEVLPVTNDEDAYEEVTVAQNENTLVATRTYEVSDIWSVSPPAEPRLLTRGDHDGADGLAVTAGGRIVYTIGEYEQSTLWSMNSEGGDRKPLIEGSGFLPFASKDGRFIAYVSTEHGIHHVRLVDSDGHNDKRLTDGSGEHFPSITPDGEWVVYASLADGHSSLWKIPTVGGQPVRLTQDVVARRPVVSHDGKMIACAYRIDETDSWKTAVLPFAGGAPLKTFALPFPQQQIIRWTSDGEGLIYLDKRDGVHNLWRQPLDGSEPSQITDFSEDLILHHDTINTGRGITLSRGGRKRDIALIRNFE